LSRPPTCLERRRLGLVAQALQLHPGGQIQPRSRALAGRPQAILGPVDLGLGRAQRRGARADARAHLGGVGRLPGGRGRLVLRPGRRGRVVSHGALECPHGALHVQLGGVHGLRVFGQTRLVGQLVEGRGGAGLHAPHDVVARGGRQRQSGALDGQRPARIPQLPVGLQGGGERVRGRGVTRGLGGDAIEPRGAEFGLAHVPTETAQERLRDAEAQQQPVSGRFGRRRGRGGVDESMLHAQVELRAPGERLHQVGAQDQGARARDARAALRVQTGRALGVQPGVQQQRGPVATRLGADGLRGARDVGDRRLQRGLPREGVLHGGALREHLGLRVHRQEKPECQTHEASNTQ
jgi:hypothetical protein